MVVWTSPLGDLYMHLDEARFYQPFAFEDGHIGYMYEMDYSISWIHMDLGVVVTFDYRDTDDRTPFYNNQDMILRIAGSLQHR